MIQGNNLLVLDDVLPDGSEINNDNKMVCKATDIRLPVAKNGTLRYFAPN